MASLIRLKQIEGYNEISAAVNVGNIITAAGGFIPAINTAVATSINTNLSSSITSIVNTALSVSAFVTTGSFNSYTQSVSQSFSASSATHTQFSASLNSVYATDYEVYITSSQIIDQGEF
jgi:hypothetical protein